MNRIVLTLLTALILTPVWAVENVSNDTYQTTQPTNDQVPNWTTGWGGSGITGWNYVGQINGASGVYLGNSWVLTAGHVVLGSGLGNFVLNGNTYASVQGSVQTIANSSGMVDICLFQINTTATNNGTVLNLPPLVVGTSDPTPFAYGTPGTSVVLIGYGGGQGETWGFNTITQNNYPVPLSVNGYSYYSNDFLTITGTTTYGDQSITNNAQLVVGDSGGGDFTYNTATGKWNLVGFNEIIGTDTDTGQSLSGFVQLDTYAAQINGIITPPTDTPTMPVAGLFIMACLLFLAASRSLGMRAGKRQPVGGLKWLKSAVFLSQAGH